MGHTTLPLSVSWGAAATGFVGWIKRACHALELAMTVRKERRSLMELSDAGLKDLGLSRSDIEGEATRSFWDVPVDRLR